MLVWCKPQFGLGNYWRNATEVLLLGVKGSLPFRDHGLRNWVEIKRGVHSRKPDRIRHMIEQVSPPAYLELFAREAVPGWVVWGNAVEQTLFSRPAPCEESLWQMR
jgi:N6-adenosine-specific RNA methylase IME4